MVGGFWKLPGAVRSPAQDEKPGLSLGVTMVSPIRGGALVRRQVNTYKASVPSCASPPPTCPRVRLRGREGTWESWQLRLMTWEG